MLFLKIHYHEVSQKDFVLTEAPKAASSGFSPTKVIVSIGGEKLNENYVVSCLFVLKHLFGHKSYILRQKLQNFQEGEAFGSQLVARKLCLYAFMDLLFFSILKKAKHFEEFRAPAHFNCFAFALKDLFNLDDLSPVLGYLEKIDSIQFQFYFKTHKVAEVDVVCKSFSICQTDS